MFDIFDKPWTLLGAAVLVLFAVLTFRGIFTEKRRRWQWLLPAITVAAALGLDFFVQTDLEKIKTVISTGTKALEEENCSAIAQIISDNYSDSYHRTKDDLILHCQRELSQPVVQKCTRTSFLFEISPPNANVSLAALLSFEKDSYIYQNFKSPLFVKLKLNLQKQHNKNWLISRVEILELDRQPVNWQQVR